MQVEYDPRQIGHVSRWNKFKGIETYQENMEESVSSCMMTVGSDAVKKLSLCIAANQQEPPVLLLLLCPKQQREKRWEGRGDRTREPVWWIG